MRGDLTLTQPYDSGRLLLSQPPWRCALIRSLHWHLIAVLSAFALVAAGCGDADPGESAASGDLVAAAAGCGSAMCGVAADGTMCGTCDGGQICWTGQCITDEIGCDESSFELDGDSAITPFAAGTQRLVYTASGPDYSVMSQPTDGEAESTPAAMKKIIIEMNHGKLFGDGPAEPGTYTLGGDDAKADCALCVRGGTFCNKSGCGKNYVVDSGTLEITSAGTPGTPFTGRLSNVIFRQIKPNDFDATTKEYTEMQQGQTWCLGDYDFDIPVPEQTQTEDNCITEGTGRLIGDNIADYTLIHCGTEEVVNLHSYCGTDKKALWLIAASGW